MPRPKRIDMDLDDVDPNGVFEDQTLVGAGDFTLDGAGVTGGEWITPDGFAKQIGFESTGNISGVTFTVTGFQDVNRHIALSEAVTGPNNSTVETTNYFYVITQIAASGAVGTNTEAGPVDEAVTQLVPINTRGGNVAVNVAVTGTINYTAQHTFSDMAQSSSFTWQNHDDADLVSSTTTQSGNYIAMPTALRFRVNSYSSGAELAITITQRDQG